MDLPVGFLNTARNLVSRVGDLSGWDRYLGLSRGYIIEGQGVKIDGK